MIWGFQAHHRLRDNSDSWLWSFSAVVMAGHYNQKSVYSGGPPTARPTSTPDAQQLDNGRTATVHRPRHGGRQGLAALPPDARPSEARGPVRRPLPHHRLRAVEPRELGHPLGLRAHAVQVAVARRARAADLGRAGDV